MTRLFSRTPVPLLIVIVLIVASSTTFAAQPNYDPPQPSAEFGTPEGTVTAFTCGNKYEHASICIKDWITLANSHHADRFVQPANVRVVSRRQQ